MLRLSPKGSPSFKRLMPRDSAAQLLFYSKGFAGRQICRASPQ